MTAVAPVEHSTVPRELQFKVLVIGEFGVGKSLCLQVCVCACKVTGELVKARELCYCY